ncbi:MAG: hypothetical protein JSR18_10565 [Proteobacteria bacterium]|nr:hypothetical protein [Pseudomonadota bacterium]
MKVTMRVDGGLAAFPGLRKPVTVDVATLPVARRERLQRAVAAADFFARSARPARPAPDARAYTIEIDDGTRSHTLALAEPIADPALQALVDAIRACSATDVG